MKKYRILAVFSLLCAIILGFNSSILTAKAFFGFGDGWLGYCCAIAGIAVDAGKFIFPAAAGLSFQRTKYGLCLIFSILTILAVGVSLGASIVQDLNQGNAIQNEAVAESGTYQRQDSIYNQTSKDIDDLKTEISNMKANKQNNEDKIRADYQPRIDNAKKLHYLTSPAGVNVADLSTARDNAIKELDTAIAQKEQDLKDKEKELKETSQSFSGISKDIKTTKGVNALAKLLDPKDPDGMLGKIQLTKDVLLEVFAIFFGICFGVLIDKKERDSNKVTDRTFEEIKTLLELMSQEKQQLLPSPAPQQQQQEKEEKEQADQDIAARKIGFEMEPKNTENKQKDFSDNDFRKYVQCMFSDMLVPSKNIVRGYDALADRTGLEKEICRKIRSTLDTLGAFRKMPGNRTQVVATETDIMKNWNSINA